LTAPILLVDCDPDWPQQFRAEATKIVAALAERAQRIEHVGSTAVPGLAAKPILDMVLAVADSAQEAEYAAALQEVGYRLHIREPEWHEHRMFKGPGDRVNLHVFSAGCLEIDRMLAFRDWLRSHDADRDLYATAKRTLAQQQWKYTQNYADAKSGIIGEILSRAGL
jgi:GrpB-like predicted nucleotidyltransferase (UPF0157 family)